MAAGHLDLINGLFEGGAACMVWLNVFRLYRDKHVAGISILAQIFFTVWGAWNLFYYPSLGQIFSAICGVGVFLGNIAWVYLVWRFRSKALG